jgi:hypothetical protein
MFRERLSERVGARARVIFSRKYARTFAGTYPSEEVLENHLRYPLGAVEPYSLFVAALYL